MLGMGIWLLSGVWIWSFEVERSLMDLGRIDRGKQALSFFPAFSLARRLTGLALSLSPLVFASHRDALQKAFTPAVFSHSEPTSRLKPGEPRLHTSMKVFVKFEEQATLLVPHRESSKVSRTTLSPLSLFPRVRTTTGNLTSSIYSLFARTGSTTAKEEEPDDFTRRVDMDSSPSLSELDRRSTTRWAWSPAWKDTRLRCSFISVNSSLPLRSTPRSSFGLTTVE